MSCARRAKTDFMRDVDSCTTKKLRNHNRIKNNTFLGFFSSLDLQHWFPEIDIDYHTNIVTSAPEDC